MAEGVWAAGATATVVLYVVTRNVGYLLMGLFLLLAATLAFVFTTAWPLLVGALLAWAVGRYAGTGLDIGRRPGGMKRRHS